MKVTRKVEALEQQVEQLQGKVNFAGTLIRELVFYEGAASLPQALKDGVDAFFGERIVHTCSCGTQFTMEQWQCLELVGVQNGEPRLELRNHYCNGHNGKGATRAIVLPPKEEP